MSYISDAHSLSSLDFKTSTDSLDIIVLGNEFQSLMAATVKKFYVAVVLVFLVTTWKSFLLVSLSVIVKNPSVAAVSYRLFRILKTTIVLPRLRLYSSVGSFKN